MLPRPTCWPLMHSSRTGPAPARLTSSARASQCGCGPGWEASWKSSGQRCRIALLHSDPPPDVPPQPRAGARADRAFLRRRGTGHQPCGHGPDRPGVPAERVREGIRPESRGVRFKRDTQQIGCINREVKLFKADHSSGGILHQDHLVPRFFTHVFLPRIGKHTVRVLPSRSLRTFTSAILAPLP